MDDMPHGVHVAGIAAAETDNAQGVAGVCWNCQIMAVKSCNFIGQCTFSNVARGIMYAVNNGADVINISLGWYEYSFSIADALSYAYNNGVVVVASADNDGVDTEVFPAYLPNTIAVAATDKNDERSIWSGSSNYGHWVDVAAPGTSIYSTVLNDNYDRWNGTSMASPFVSGLAGLIISEKGDLSPDDIKNILIDSADAVTV